MDTKAPPRGNSAIPSAQRRRQSGDGRAHVSSSHYRWGPAVLGPLSHSIAGSHLYRAGSCLLQAAEPHQPLPGMRAWPAASRGICPMGHVAVGLCPLGGLGPQLPQQGPEEQWPCPQDSSAWALSLVLCRGSLRDWPRAAACTTLRDTHQSAGCTFLPSISSWGMGRPNGFISVHADPNSPWTGHKH